MASLLDDLALRRFTVEEYHRMAETGILGPDERVELVRGVLRRMSPKSRAHVVAVDCVGNLLRDALRGRASVYQEAPLVAESIDSEPEPDILVCSNPDPTAYATARTAPLLVVEVADSSLAYDLGEKAAIYADAGIPEYWVVDLAARSLEVLREPRPGGYEARSTLEGDARVRPGAWPDLVFEVSVFFLPPEDF